MNPRQYGAEGERLAEAYLVERGARILARNYRCPMGEIDLVVQMEGFTVFVEVKRRDGARYGRGAEAVGPRKQAHIARAAAWYLKSNRLADARMRFDVIEVMGDEIRHLRAAFYAKSR